MADERSVIDALSDESKAVAINDLVAQITRLTDAARAATQNLNKVRGERAALDSSGGITGALARRIKDSQVNEARSAYASIYSEIQAARLRMVNLTGSRVTNFRRREGESDAHASLRLRGLTQQYGHALGVATRYGATADGEYIGSGEVSNTAREFRSDPNAERFRYQEPDRAAGIVKAFFGSKMQKFATLGGKYFSMANPLMQKARPFFGHGGFNFMGGLRAMGPLGMAASVGVSVVKQAYNFQRGVHRRIQGLENEALLSGLSTGGLSSFGAGLMAFGGNLSGAARLSGGIASTLGGMRYGMGGGNLVAAARMFGLNLMSGNGGLASTEEILMRMSELMENANGMQKEQLAFMASQLGLSADQVRMMRKGPKKFAEQLHATDYITQGLNTPRAVEAAERSDQSFAAMKLAWELAVQKMFSESGFTEGVNKLLEGYANAINSNKYGEIGGVGNLAAQALSSWGASSASIGSKIVQTVGGWFGADMEDYSMDSFVDMMKAKRIENEGEGSPVWAAMWAGLETLGSIFTTEGPFTHLMKEDNQFIPETVSDSGGGGYITIEPANVKIEATVNTSASTFGGAAEDFGNAVNPAIQSGLRQKAKQLIGAER